MQLNALLLLQLMFILHEASSLKKLMKPSFIPYCTTRDRCQPACSCEILPNCELLNMDNTTRESILFYHNQIRGIQTRAEPQPGGMAMLKYDDQLEELSKCWAARCENDYSECFLSPNYPETSMSVTQLQLGKGQNPTNILWIQVINHWLGNTKYLSVETINSMPAGEKGEILRNYAQLMCDRILSIGCAWSKTEEILTCVCTYGPRGPMQGEPIYRAGTPCTLCPKNYACDNEKPFENLCKEVTPTTPEVLETPPSPPPSPSRKNYNIMRSQYLPPRLRSDRIRVRSQSIPDEEQLEIEYEPPQQSPDIELVAQFEPMQDSRPPPYLVEENVTEDPIPPYPPHLPPEPSEYPTPNTSPRPTQGHAPQPPPALPKRPGTSNWIPPPPPLPHLPLRDIPEDKKNVSAILTTTGLSAQTLPQLLNPSRVPMNTPPSHVPERNVVATREQPPVRRYHRRSSSSRIASANVMIYITLLIALHNT
ncbi:peptidase inhibitor 16-like [Coccinella septempunctata]|uniref:peptidase inhibitor 16-like n=1 Tax=Coccinella septempunctata TaxID=41139 RepID=UPI001D06E820|nr:peptidase inhibitor 16-like [Coccinella septempunctata]